MNEKKQYEHPELEEYFLSLRPNLMTDMSAELPDGADEGDSNTFGSVTYK